jgi:large subunit ribosomal protein L6
MTKGVDVSLTGGKLTVKGPRGTLTRTVASVIGVDHDKASGRLRVTTQDLSPGGRAVYGLARALLRNMVQGVSTGFVRKLEINGVGYRAEVAGSTVHFTLGYSHPIAFPLPDGVKASLEKNVLTLEGADREVIGQTAAKIRDLRVPEPYKGKGIKYVEETIRRKVGKAGATA